MTRKESREQAFVLLFEYSFNKETVQELLNSAREAEIYKEDEFCEKLVTTAIENIDELDAQIGEYSSGWSTNRISKVVLAALRLALTEIKYFDDIPASVSANEAVELIKKFATEQDASYANGILGSIIRKDRD